MTDEHDDLPDERRLLASAYLDDELSPADRARAEADPAVLAEVEALRSVRAALAAVPAPDPGRRDAAIAAAVATAGTTVEAPPQPTVEARRRARWYAPLAAAAAVAVLVVGGIVALRDGGGDDDAGSSDVTRQAPAETQTADEDDNEAGEAAATTAAVADAPDAAAPPTAAGGAETTQTAGESATEATTSAEETEDSFDASAPIVRGGPDLLALVEIEEAAGSDRTESPAAARSPQCELGTFVTFARYQPSAAGEPVDIEVIVDPSGIVLAADAVTCEVLLSATP